MTSYSIINYFDMIKCNVLSSSSMIVLGGEMPGGGDGFAASGLGQKL
jgi:hypothetical protein